MNTCLEPPPVKTNVGNHFISNYPPFSCWNTEDIAGLHDALKRPPAPKPIGLYVHIPFCRQRCHYCYFRVYPQRAPSDVFIYLELLLKELSLYEQYPALQGRAINSVYFGGGSPSYLSAAQIAHLVRGLQRRCNWHGVEEFTFECEPGTMTPDKLDVLKDLGVTRLTFGFQTLNDAILRKNGRNTTVRDCIESYRLAREAGFEEINIDLLAGLPGETAASWSRTIEHALALAPDCVTIYQMELTHNSAIYKTLQAGRKVALPSWETKRQWVGEAFETFERAGYVIGSGYMAIRDPSRWRFVYTVENFWHGADLLGLGESAFGHLSGVHYQNMDAFEPYVRSLEEGKLPVRRALKTTAEERLRREVILQLKTGSLDAAYFRQKFGIELVSHFEPQFESLVKGELLRLEGDSLRLTRKGLLEVDWLLPQFYLPEHAGVRYT